LLAHEVLIPASINHPATLRLVGVGLAPVPVFVTEIMNHGTLEKAIAERPPGFCPTQLSICLFGIVAGLAYPHSPGIIHGDRKPANGITQRMPIGTPPFIAPELFGKDQDYGPKVDVSAFGVTLSSFFAEPKTLKSLDMRYRKTRDLCGSWACPNRLRC
jgi:serine/threonine protein kinase